MSSFVTNLCFYITIGIFEHLFLPGTCVDVGITVNNTCPDTYEDYTCDGYWCGSLSCENPATMPVQPPTFEVGVNVSEWCQYEWYDCSDMISSYKNLSDKSVTQTKRKRREITTMSSEEMNALRIAYTCSVTITDGGDKERYDLNSMLYITTFHGMPGWFKDCEQSRQMNAPGACCIHHYPTFWTWHRLYMVQIENSLRQWDDSLSLPYWNWVDYKDWETMELPELLREPYFQTEVNGTKYRNPYHIYQTSEESWEYYETTKTLGTPAYCKFSKQYGSPGLYNIMHPQFGDSLFKQIYNSLFYKSFIAMDLPGEVAHDNVHDLMFGNMPNLVLSSLTPVFMTHHGAVEKYFLIWQMLMKNVLDIDYTDSNVQKQYFGCLATNFKIDAYLAPFNWDASTTNATNSDPITFSMSESGLKSMDYDALYYVYDNYDIYDKDNETLAREICKYFKETGKGCAKYDDIVDGSFESSYNASMFIGWYVPLDHYGMKLEYQVYRYSERYEYDNMIFNDSFRILSGGYDAWDEVGTRFLYKRDVTQLMEEQGVDFASEYIFVNYSVTVQVAIGNNWTQDEYEVYGTGDEYLDYPVLIYRDGYEFDSDETYQIYLGDDHYYGGNSVMLNPGVSLDERNHNVRVHLIDIYENVESEVTFNISDSGIDIVFNNDLYQNNDIVIVSDEDNTNTVTNYLSNDEYYTGNGNGSSLGNVVVRRVEFNYTYGSQNFSSSSEKNTYYFSYTSENTVKYGSNTHKHFADQLSYQGFDGRFFTTDDMGLLKNEIENILEEGQLNVPWDLKFVSEDSSLYGHTHTLVGWSFSDSLNLVGCVSDSCSEDSAAFVVYTEEDYDNCDSSSAARNSKDSFSTFSCSNGWKFESETTYYFISTNETACNDGLKFAIKFLNTTDCAQSSTGPSCTIPKGWVGRGTIPSNQNGAGKELTWSVAATEDNCDRFEYKLQGHIESGWWAYGFYGPYTDSTATGDHQMKGIAFVAFECNNECHGQNSSFVQFWWLIKTDDHTLILDLSKSNNTCSHDYTDGIKTVTCDVMTSEFNKFSLFTELPSGFNFEELGLNKTYYHLYAEHITSNCDSAFNDQHDEGRPPLLPYKYYDESGTDTMMDGVNTTMASSGDSDGMDDTDGVVMVRNRFGGAVILAMCILWSLYALCN